MARKQIKISRRMLFTWFMLAGLIFLFAPQQLTNKFQFTFARIFQWPLSISRNISLSARTTRQLTSYKRLKDSQYQNYIAYLQEQLRQKNQKVEQLSKLRDRPDLEDAKFLPADIITASIGPTHAGFIINRGKNDGLANGQFVLGNESIIGTISALDPHTARVKLITDPSSKLQVRIDDVARIMKGNGRNSAKIDFFPHQKNVKTGDFVYACKKAGMLDTPLIIAKVSMVKPNPENPLSHDIIVEPACNLEKLSNVTVLIMNPDK